MSFILCHIPPLAIYRKGYMIYILLLLEIGYDVERGTNIYKINIFEIHILGNYCYLYHSPHHILSLVTREYISYTPSYILLGGGIWQRIKLMYPS